jgi:hypothetical protein
MSQVDENGMIDMKVPAGAIIISSSAGAEVIKAADIQPENKE